MDRGAKTPRTVAAAKRPAARKSRTSGPATTRDIETRLAEALEQQAATNEILRLMAASPGDVQPVLDAVAERAAHLCKAPFARVLLGDGSALHVLADYADDGGSPMSAVPVVLKRTSISGRAVLDSEVIHHADIVPLLDTEFSDARENVRRIGCRAVLAVPLMREAGGFGAIFLWRREPGLFAPDQVALVQTFARQAAIAIDNVRLFKEVEVRNQALTEALEQQTATSDILRVISSSPTDVQPVFDAIARDAMRLCNADYSVVGRYDGQLLHLVAHEHVRSEGVQAMLQLFPMRPSRETTSSRAILDRAVVHVPDVLEDSDYARPVALGIQNRSTLAAPMLRYGEPIGTISVGRLEPLPFSENQIALLKTFADQAVIAIENVRLFTELEARNHDLSEALEQQTATSDILRVISGSPTDVQPVFDTIAQSALTLCGASAATMLTFDGALIHLAAVANVKPEATGAIRKLFPRPPSRDTAGTRAILTRGVVAIPDVLEDTDYSIGNASHFTGFRGVMAVPLIRDDAPIGAIAVGRPEPGPFSEKQIALLRTFADQAVIAIENVRLFTELDARTTQLTQSVGELKALGEVGQAVSSTLDLETVLRTIVARATELSGVDGGAIYEYDEAKEQFYMHTADRYPAELVDVLRAKPIRKGEGALGRLAVVAEPVQIRNIAEDRTYRSRVREILLRLGYRSLLAIPLVRDEHLLGGLVVNRTSAGEFAPQVIELLKTFATQSALAIQNARLFREIEDKGRQLEIASRHKSEFLANMSHELRTPLNAIIGFSEVLAERMFGEINEKQAEYLADILESGRHLLTLINDILDLSKIEAGRMELEPSDFSLPGAIDNALTLVRERAQRREITLARTFDPRVGDVHGDERKVKQVLLNLLSNALKFTPEGGRIDVETAIEDGMTRISVIDTGVGIAHDDLEAVFEEFRQVGTAARKVEGTGLGLAISRKFIELHGGRIWVTSKPGVGSTFAFTLPRPGGAAG